MTYDDRQFRSELYTQLHRDGATVERIARWAYLRQLDLGDIAPDVAEQFRTLAVMTMGPEFELPWDELEAMASLPPDGND